MPFPFNARYSVALPPPSLPSRHLHRQISNPLISPALQSDGPLGIARIKANVCRQRKDSLCAQDFSHPPQPLACNRFRRLRIVAAGALFFAASLFLCPANAYAAAVDTWDGTADTIWYTGDKTTYDISTAEQLAGIAELSTRSSNRIAFDGVTLSLKSDLDLSGHNWKAIGNFSGTIQGNGHTISNLTCQAGTTDYPAFIGSLFGATVKDLDLENAMITRSEDNKTLAAGILACTAYDDDGRSTVIRNCSTSGTITSNLVDSWGSAGLGGILGSAKNSTQLIGCSSSANVIATDPTTPDMLGGIVGQWENASDGALIDSCYFTGSISTTCDENVVGGILGIGLMFSSDTELVKNCFSIPKKIEAVTPEYTYYIASFEKGESATGSAVNCFWPAGNVHGGVAQMNIVWEGSNGTPTPDPKFDQNTSGTAVSDFSDPSVLKALNAAASTSDFWAMGIDGHPVFSRQEALIGADYSAVDAALQKVPADLSGYTPESVKALRAAMGAVVRGKNVTEQETVDGYADALGEALSGLELLADYSAVDSALAKAPQDKSLYTPDSVAALDQAVAAVVRGKGASEQAAVDAYASAIERALSQLVYRDADYSAVDAALQRVPADLSGYTPESVKALRAAMGAVVRGKNVTEQETVDGYAAAIAQALQALAEKTTEGGATNNQDPGNGKTGTAEKPATDSKPGNATGPKPKDASDAESDALLPQTGDESLFPTVCFGMVGMLLSGMGAVGLLRNED